MKNTRTRQIAVLSLLIAIAIICSQFLKIGNEMLQITFTFIPNSIIGSLFGPLWSVIGLTIADVIGAALFPTGTFFPGFTLNAIISGFIYGYFLYKKPFTWSRITLVVLLNTIIINIILTQIWLNLLYHTPFAVMMPMRLVKQCINAPIEIFLMHLILNRLPIEKWRLRLGK